MEENSVYDPSVDYLRYPTFAPITQNLVRCSGCGGKDFRFLLPGWDVVCGNCGLELELPEDFRRVQSAESCRDELQSDEFRSDVQICGGWVHRLVLDRNGNVTAIGENRRGQSDVKDS